MKKEIYITCNGAEYDLYNILNPFFEVEIIDLQDNTMGIIDALKVLVEPITRSVEMLGNAIIAIINAKKCTITIKNGDKEISFEGKLKDLDNDRIIRMISELLEG